MAITFVGSNTQAVSGSTPISLSLPASNQNDLVIVFTGVSDETKGGPPSTSGYTAIADVLHATGNCRLHASYKVMGSTPDTSVSVPATLSTSVGLGVLALVFRGVDTTTSLDVAVSTANTATSTPGGTGPGVTPVNNNCCIVTAASAANWDTTVGSVSGYLPIPSVQITVNTTGSDATVAAAYNILSGGAGVAQRPATWSTWDTGDSCAVVLALRPTTVSTDFNTVDPGTVTTTGKAVVQVEKVAVTKASVSYIGKTIGIPDSSVEIIFVDAADITTTGKTVDVTETFRAVTVDKASVLYRGRNVTVREVQFEDIPKYTVKGRGSGHWMETR